MNPSSPVTMTSLLPNPITNVKTNKLVNTVIPQITQLATRSPDEIISTSQQLNYFVIQSSSPLRFAVHAW